MSDWLISYTKIFVIARWICTKWHYFSKCANFGCRRPKMTNFIPKWPSLPRLNDRSGFLSVSKRGIWLQYARSTKHSLYYNANKQYGHVCTRCFFDIKAVSHIALILTLDDKQWSYIVNGQLRQHKIVVP